MAEKGGGARRPAGGWLTPAQTARLFGVHPRTVSRWARAGRLKARRTLGGHLRFRRDEVQEPAPFQGPESEPPGRGTGS